MIDGLNDTAHETAPWRRILNADRRASVPIGECTSDNGVHVHRNAIFMCAPALPYVAGCLTVAARPAELRRRSGAFGRRRERPPLSGCLDRHRGGLACARPCHPPHGGSLPAMDPYGKVVTAMRRPALILAGAAAVAAIAHAFWAPFPTSGGNPVLDLIAYHDPGFHTVIRVWYYVAPAVAVLLAGSLGLSVWRVWLQPRAGGGRGRGTLPRLARLAERGRDTIAGRSASSTIPSVPRESERPSWLVVPETGLYTGVLIVGAVGSGKTSACMYPFAQQLLSWQADWPARRANALVLEVKGDFCHDVRGILEEAGRADDYLEIGLDGSWQWNPLDDPLLDTYSLAYSVSSLINQLFGKSREPFWQQAYTNLVRWIIELHRLLPGGWVTLQDVYRCTIDAELFAERIREAKDLVAEACPARVVISHDDMIGHPEALNDWVWIYTSGEDTVTCRLDPVLRDRLAELKIPFETEEGEGGAGSEFREQVEAIERWYLNDWMALDAKLRTSIVEGISVFLSLFDQPGVAGVGRVWTLGRRTRCSSGGSSGSSGRRSPK